MSLKKIFYYSSTALCATLFYALIFHTAIAASNSNKTLTSEQVTQKINELQKTLSDEDQKKAALSQKMHGNKQALHKTTVYLKTLKKQIQNHQIQLQALQKQQQSQQQQLTQQQKLLMSQIQTLYFLKKQNAMSWLLSGNTVADQERFINYFHYIEKAQLLTLQNSLMQQAQICQLTTQINNQATLLQQQHEKTIVMQQHLNQQQLQQQKNLALLNKTMQAQAVQLKQLMANKRALEKVVSHLSTSELPEVKPTNSTFATTAGHLLWPLKGQIEKHYGAPIGQDLFATGVVLRAKSGQPVQAVYSGKVVFADYLKGFGLLVIIDHGQGYLTLYGQNKTIYTKVGTQVSAGQKIAEVGDNFGEGKFSGLYFEIRQSGHPVNPEQWCRAKPNKLFS